MPSINCQTCFTLFTDMRKLDTLLWELWYFLSILFTTPRSCSVANTSTLSVPRSTSLPPSTFTWTLLIYSCTSWQYSEETGEAIIKQTIHVFIQQTTRIKGYKKQNWFYSYFYFEDLKIPFIHGSFLPIVPSYIAGVVKSLEINTKLIVCPSIRDRKILYLLTSSLEIPEFADKNDVAKKYMHNNWNNFILEMMLIENCALCSLWDLLFEI